MANSSVGGWFRNANANKSERVMVASSVTQSLLSAPGWSGYENVPPCRYVCQGPVRNGGARRARQDCARVIGETCAAVGFAPPVVDADRCLSVPAKPQDWLAERKGRAGRGSTEAGRRGASRRAGASIDEGMLRIERTAAAVPDGAGDLVADLYQRIPDTRITDILLEVDAATRFTEAFTHLRTGAPCRDRIGLLNVLLAEGINLGLRKMADATTTHGFWELMRIARWHVECEASDRALSVVVEAQAALPMAAFWGAGRTASSDGQFFPAGRPRRSPQPWSTPATEPSPASRRTRTSPTGSPRSPPRPSPPPSTKPLTSSTDS